MARKKTKKLDTKVYYDFGILDSYGAMFNMVVGVRGNGKTYGAKYKAIKNFLKYGSQFVYLRRYRDELHTFSTFFNDISDRFPDYEFRCIGRNAQCRRRCDNDEYPWKIMGYAVALSTAQQLKGTSYPLVTSIIFDEFIIEKGLNRYLPNEVQALLNFYNTVDRYNDRVRVYFLANAVSIANPYFVHFGIDISSKIRTYFNRYVAVEFCGSYDYINEVEKSRFGAFIRQVDSEYAEYVMDNSFNDNGTTFIEKKHPEMIHVFNIEVKSGQFSVWMHPDNMNTMHVQSKIILSHYCFTTMMDKVREGWTFIEKNNKLLKMSLSCYRNGRMTFDKPQTRVVFNDLSKV